MKPRIVTVTGISCSGKTFLASYANENNTPFKEAIGTTTRPPRAGEVNGVDYDFVTVEQFKEMEVNNELLESVCYSGHYYGRSVSRMQKIYDEGKIPLMVVEPIGANNISKKCSEIGFEAINVFIECPTDFAIKRWVDRYQIDVSKGLYQHAFYANRIAKTLTVEQSWKKACNYHLTINHADNALDTAKQINSIKDVLGIDFANHVFKETVKYGNANSLTILEDAVCYALLQNKPVEEIIKLPQTIKNSISSQPGVSL